MPKLVWYLSLFDMLTYSGNHLTIQRTKVSKAEFPENDDYGHSFVCRTCPYEFIVDKEYYSRRESKLKQVDDIMGGAAAWENVDQTNGISSKVKGLIFSPNVPEQTVWVDKGLLSTNADSEC